MHNRNENRDRSALRSFFSPAAVALVGATDREKSVGRTVLENLQATFRGRIYPVNPNRRELFGLTCHSSIEEIPEPVDLVVIAVPATGVPAVVSECVRAQSKAIVVISAGFREKGPEGAQLEDQIKALLRGTTTRLIGPNCLGLMYPLSGLNATFAQRIARPGSVAFLSQSGALLTAILDWSITERVGFSAIVSTGSMLDVGWGDLLSHFGEDPNTKSILLYMESIGDARSFLSAAREVSFTKPIVVIKAGRSEAGSRAAQSHTGAMTGSDAAYDAAFRRSGVLRVQNIAELFHMADVLAKQPRPRGPRLLILTNAGGPGVLATDALLQGGGELARLSSESESTLNAFLPKHWSHANPIDILGDADPERYGQALDVALADPNNDGLLVILAPQGMTNPAQVAEQVKLRNAASKPLLASWMGGDSVRAGIEILNDSGVPMFSYPDAAARAFLSMWSYSEGLRSLYEPSFSADDPEQALARRNEVEDLLRGAVLSGRTLLTELESKAVLDRYRIPTVPTRLARDQEEAAARAEEIGFPVVLKLHSETVTHKTDVGGVRLNLRNRNEVEEAFRAIAASVTEKAGGAAFLGVTVQPMIQVQGCELIVGSAVDAQFGPILLFGSGGRLVEIYRDQAVALPPLTTTLARRMMERTRIFGALRGARGSKPVDERALEALLVRFSELVTDQRRIREIEINPLLASGEGLVALDARIALFGPETADVDLPRSAIRPYPIEHVSHGFLKDRSRLVFRPIRAADEALMVRFHESLSDATVYSRYFRAQRLESRIAHDQMVRKCFVDYDREIALVAERRSADTNNVELVAVGRLIRQRNREDTELGVVVADRCQSAGIGTKLVARLIHIAREEGVRLIRAEILAENAAMVALASHFAFDIRKSEDPATLFATLDLAPIQAKDDLDHIPK